jgi:hypothetical protein
MPYTPAPTLVDNESLTHTWFQTLKTNIEAAFDHNVQPADITWPLVLDGPIDFSDFTFLNLTNLGTVHFADKYASIQAAINAANAQGGGIVLLGPKSYSVSSTIDMQSGSVGNHNVQLIGCGRSSVIQATAPFTGTEVITVANQTSSAANRMVLHNFQINLSGVSAVDGIQTNNVEECIISYIYITNAPQYGIVLNRTIETICEYCDINLSTAATSGILINANTADSKRLIIRHNRITGINNENQRMYMRLSPPPNSIIANNIMDAMAEEKTGIYINDDAGFNITDLLITDNLIFRDNLSLTDTLGRGIVCEGNAAANFSMRGIRIVNNVIYNVGQDAIAVLGAGSPSTGIYSNFTIAGNVIRLPGRDGIRLRQNCTRMTVTGNNISGPNARAQSGFAIRLSQASSTYKPTWITVHGNVMTWVSLQDGITAPQYAVNSGANCDKCLAVGNSAKGFSAIPPYLLPGLGSSIGENVNS